MKSLKFLLLSFILMIPIISKSQKYCEFIQNIQNYQDSVKLKYAGENDIIEGNDGTLEGMRVDLPQEPLQF